MLIIPPSRRRIERKATVLHILQRADSIPIEKLAQQMEVSSSTLRRELRDLVNPEEAAKAS